MDRVSGPAPFRRIGGICFIACISAACEAKAAAFLQPQGQGLIIVSSSFDRSDRYFGPFGRLQSVPLYRKLDIGTYAEFGAAERLTLLFATSSSMSFGTVSSKPAADQYNFIQAGGRLKLWEDGPSIFSIQATLQAPLLQARMYWARLRSETSEADIRLMYGYNFTLVGASGFLSVEPGYRYRVGNEGEARLDVTAGLRPWPELLLLAQSFNMMSALSPNAKSRRSHKLQPSIVYDLLWGWSAQLAVYAVVSGQNVRQEQGALIGFWRKF